MTPPLPRSWRALAALCLAFVCVSFVRSAELVAMPPLPTFTGYLSAPREDALFILRWQSSQGGTFESWAHLGERAGEFKLVEFDAKTETLAVADPSGRTHRLVLPGGKVRPPEVEIADEEFARLVRYLLPATDKSTAPVLNRE